MIYWVKAGDAGPVKIGYAARDVAARLRFLQTGCPWPLILLRTAAGERDLEGALHAHYRAKRFRAEWFFLTDDEVSVDLTTVPATKTAYTGPVAPFCAELIAEITEFRLSRGMTEGQFGRAATGDSRFVERLRMGKGTLRVFEKAEAYMQGCQRRGSSFVTDVAP